MGDTPEEEKLSNVWLRLLNSVFGSDPFKCPIPGTEPEEEYSHKCATSVSIIALVFCFLSFWVIKMARKKLDGVLNELTNLFGVSIFTIRVFEQIIIGMKLMIFEEIWHVIMMQTSIVILNHGLGESNGAHVL
jgi:hypothetical protein